MTKTYDLNVMRKNLRKSTAELLKYDINAPLTAAQEVRLSRAYTLRIQIDDLETAKLNNAQHEFDTKAYVAASEALERMLGGTPEQTSPTHDFSGAREELANFFARRAEALDHREQRESERLRDECAKLREEIAKLKAKIPVPGGGDAHASSDTHLPLSPAAAGSNVVPIDAAARAEERARDERAWRDYTYNNGGAVVAPAWSPPDHRR